MAEVRALLRLVERGASVASVRQLIGLSPTEEKTLRAFAGQNPSEGKKILAVIEFRRRVLEEFDRLTAAGRGNHQGQDHQGIVRRWRLRPRLPGWRVPEPKREAIATTLIERSVSEQ